MGLSPGKLLARSEISGRRTGDFRTPEISGSNSDSASPEVSAEIEKDLGAEKIAGAGDFRVSARKFPDTGNFRDYFRSIIITVQC